MKEIQKFSLLRISVQFLLFILLLLISTTTASAIGAADGSDHKLTIDGNLIQTTVPPYIESGRSLVPARAVFEAIGATVEWSSDNPNHVGIAYANTQVSLTLNSSTAYVNGEEKTLEVPARLHNNSTMIPVRFVSEALSFGVGYDVDQRIIQLTSPKISQTTYGSIDKITYEDLQYFYRIAITSNDSIQTYQASTLSNPNRYVLDLTGFTLDSSVSEKILPPDVSNNAVFTAIRTSQFTPDTVRVVVDLLDKQTGSLTLSSDKKTLYIDFSKQYTSDAPVVPTKDPTTANGSPNKRPSTLNEVLILIDPGHGGIDPGSQGRSNGTVLLNEKDINLDVATRLNEKLSNAGFNTMMSRSGDHFVSASSKNAKEDLIARSDLANRSNITLVISIHNNSAAKAPSARGTETLYNETDEKSAYGISSKELATLIQKKMVSYAGTYNRGAKSRPDLSILRRTEMPAIIVEGAFLSNANDLQLMLTDTFRENYATAVSEAVVEYLSSLYQ
ncbi:N-acetylmuramoyl-L-alanine amidase family protein [Sinanaerobacter sp. ZZT-01]|uniref:N-acetylmuramoyl-L-alanine amidase family protein n=1 Tax=Sinanaerobacter sp. ZZT-01 TaxID=3111540 RepID=UPI002D78AA04|nr:N-acetylmuramoyl-L-alanine amidase family protein [Sinanaerobacter sp. ZZT-01]WRR92028.1 N-acetylmuramoyl-L-alanine amidase family protein [Sinanaerobacter sp. ZZT-01]